MSGRRGIPRSGVLMACLAGLATVSASAGDRPAPEVARPGAPRLRAPTPPAHPTTGAAMIAPWAGSLWPVHVENANTGAAENVALYTRDGRVDPRAVTEFSLVAAWRGEEAPPLDARVVQLVFKAAYHFSAPAVSLLSAWRPRAGYHTRGQAVDFTLSGVTAKTLAAYLRTLPRAGVGVYVHPRTQFVHVDTREKSYHWVDASPPRVTWRAVRLPDPGRAARDASFTPRDDLPLPAP